MNKKSVKHISLEDSKNIELGIIEGLSKSQIAKNAYFLYINLTIYFSFT